jgi:hypothetical protein
MWSALWVGNVASAGALEASHMDGCVCVLHGARVLLDPKPHPIHCTRLGASIGERSAILS